MHIRTDAYIEKASKLTEGEVEFIVSTGALDAYGEKIDVGGINLKDFKKNPVVLFGHDSFNLPIAKATKVYKDGDKLIARAKFYLKDEFPRKVYDYIVDGFLQAVSIGGMVDEWGEDGMTIKRMTMKEFSVVSIPANPEALVLNKSLDDNEITELKALASRYARKQFSDDNVNQLKKDVNTLKSLVATLEEVVQNEPNEQQATTQTLRIALKQNQAVDKQAEQISKSIKVILKE